MRFAREPPGRGRRVTTLTKLRDSAAECTRCDLYQHGAQTVSGDLTLPRETAAGQGGAR